MASIQAGWMPRWASYIVNRIGWRIVAIVLIGIITAAITAALLLLGFPQDPATFWGAVLASWVGGVALFFVAGLIVAIVSLVPPETSSFNSRARILFRGKGGAHFDYIVERIKETLEQYSELTERTLSVWEYDGAEGKYLVRTKVTSRMKSYVEDMESAAKTPIRIVNTTTSPPGRGKARIIHVRCGNQPVIAGLEFDDELDREYVVRIPEGGETIVETLMEYWVKQVEEAYTNSPVRYIRAFRLTVENNLTVNLRLKLGVREDQPQEITVRPASVTTLLNLRDVNPNGQLFDIRLLEPAP